VGKFQLFEKQFEELILGVILEVGRSVDLQQGIEQIDVFEK
jgi:hypothetical protein